MTRQKTGARSHIVTFGDDPIEQSPRPGPAALHHCSPLDSALSSPSSWRWPRAHPSGRLLSAKPSRATG
jgi:hypothetical protein